MSYIQIHNKSWLNKDHIVTAKVESTSIDHIVIVTTSQGTLQKVAVFDNRQRAYEILHSIVGLDQIYETETDAPSAYVEVEKPKPIPKAKTFTRKKTLIWKKDEVTATHIAEDGKHEHRIRRLKTGDCKLESDKELMKTGDKKKRFKTLKSAKEYCERSQA